MAWQCKPHGLPVSGTMPRDGTMVGEGARMGTHATVFLARHCDCSVELRAEGTGFSPFLSGQVALPHLAAGSRSVIVKESDCGAELQS